MTSQKQIKANRANARLSTGPKSDGGKQRSRANAATHGLTAKQIIVPGETPEQFERLRKGLIADFAPGTTIEFELIDQLAALLLRRRRPPVVEAVLLKTLINPSFEDSLGALTTEELEQLEKISRKMLENRGVDLSEIAERQSEEGKREAALPRRVEMLNVFARYETHIMNEIVKTVRLLLSLQERRVGSSPKVERLSAR
jgi:hypothetical protein